MGHVPEPETDRGGVIANIRNKQFHNQETILDD